MLPWLNALDNNKQANSSFENLASKYIRDVSYTSKKLDEPTSFSFLKFKLFVKRNTD